MITSITIIIIEYIYEKTDLQKLTFSNTLHFCKATLKKNNVSFINYISNIQLYHIGTNNFFTK